MRRDSASRLTCTAMSRLLAPTLGRWLVAAMIVAAGWACSGELPLGSEDLEDPTDADTAQDPIVTRVEPSVLPAGETLDLRIFGSGFDASSRVHFTRPGAPPTAVVTNSTSFISSGELVANVTTAADAPLGPYDVVVTSGTGKQGVGTELIDLDPPAGPAITGIHPSPAVPGTFVAILGSGFGSDETRLRVTFGGIEGRVLSADDTLVGALVPRELASGTAVVELSVTGVSRTASIALEIVQLSPSTAEPGEVVTLHAPILVGAPHGLSFVTVSMSVPPGEEIAAPVLGFVFGNPEIEGLEPSSIRIVVPWGLPAGNATVRVTAPAPLLTPRDPFPGSITAEYPLTIVRTKPVPNVGGYYWNIIENVSFQDYFTSMIVSQDGSMVTVTLSGGSENAPDETRGGWTFTGNLSATGQFQAVATTPGCERRRLNLTFSETGYVGSVACEDPGSSTNFLNFLNLIGYRE